MRASWFKRELAVMKDEIKNPKMGSGSTVCSEASTGMGLGLVPSLGHRHLLLGGMTRSLQERWTSKVEAQIALRVAHTESHFEELTKFLTDLDKMVPQQARKWSDWDQTRKEQGPWPRKIMVSVWFKHETSLVTMIGLRRIMKEELDKAAYKIHGQNVMGRLEVSPQRRPLAKTQALFFKGLKEVGGGESKVRAFHGKLQISFFG